MLHVILIVLGEKKIAFSNLQMFENKTNDLNELPRSVKNDLRNVIMKEDFVQLQLTALCFTMCKGFTCNLVFGIHSNKEIFEVNSDQILQLKQLVHCACLFA